MGELAGGVWPGTDYRPGTHGPALVRALHDVHNGKVAWGDSERGGLRIAGGRVSSVDVTQESSEVS